MSYDTPYITGKYKGDAAAGRLISVGFQPIWIFIMGSVSDNLLVGSSVQKSADSNNDAVFTTAAVDAARYIDLVPQGFLLDTSSTGFNVLDEWFYYIAFNKSAGSYHDGYTGDGGSARLIPIGKKPSAVWCVQRTTTTFMAHLNNYPVDEYDEVDTNYVNNTGGGDIELSGPTVFAEYPRPHAKPDGLYILAQPRLARRG